jgi:hypothetical protein
MKMTKVSENLHYFYLLAGKLYFMNILAISWPSVLLVGKPEKKTTG